MAEAPDTERQAVEPEAGEVLVRAFGYTVASRYLDNSEEMIREQYSHIEAGEFGDVTTEALDEIDGER